MYEEVIARLVQPEFQGNMNSKADNNNTFNVTALKTPLPTRSPRHCNKLNLLVVWVASRVSKVLTRPQVPVRSAATPRSLHFIVHFVKDPVIWNRAKANLVLL